MTIIYTLSTAPLPGLSTQLLVTVNDFQQIAENASNWAVSNFTPILPRAKQDYLNPDNPPPPRPESYALTGRKDGLLLHVYDLDAPLPPTDEE